MADGDMITYDYPVIQNCVDKMKQFVTQVEQHGDELTTRTKQLMAGHWAGDSANEYDRKSTDMKQKLEGIQHALTTLHGKVSDGAQELQDADRAGAK